MKIASCNRPQGKPKVCADWPLTARMLEPFADKCGYLFDADGIRHGECNRCGACCECVFLQFDELVEEIRGERCPYLVVMDSGD